MRNRTSFNLVKPTLWSEELPKLETFEIFTANSHQLWKLTFLIVAFLVSRNIILLPRCGLRFWTERSVWDPQALSNILQNLIWYQNKKKKKENQV